MSEIPKMEDLDQNLQAMYKTWNPMKMSDFQGKMDLLADYDFVSICARYDQATGIFDAGADPYLFLPGDRKLWESKIAQKLKFGIQCDEDLYWPYASGGMLVLIRDKHGQVGSFLERRSPNVSYPGHWNIPLGFPKCQRGDDIFAEQTGNADCAMREVIEECIVVDKDNNRLIPDVFLKEKKEKAILAKVIAVNEELISQYASRFALAYPKGIKNCKSYFLPLRNEVGITLKIQGKIWTRRGIKVFGTKTQNLDIVRVLVMEFEGNLDELTFYDGEALGNTKQPLNLEVGMGKFSSQFYPLLNDPEKPGEMETLRVRKVFKSGSPMDVDMAPTKCKSVPALQVLIEELKQYSPFSELKP